MKIISFGGGVNSVAMTIMLYKRGEIYPLVFADTMAEHPETYCYMDYFEREFLSKYGQKIVRLNPIDNPEYYEPANKGLALYDWFWNLKFVPLPMQSACSTQYKRRPLTKYAKKPHIMGFAMDEQHRATGKDIYPLIENKIDRNGCIEIIKQQGLSIPIKSGCYFCAMQRISQWEDTYKNNPDLFQRAIDLEHNTHLTIRDKPLEYLRDRFNGRGGDLFPDYDYEELTPCMCIT
jgi:hypothetical protein